MPVTISDVAYVIEQLAPVSQALSWDNPGLQAGNPDRVVKSILFALDVSPQVLEEAVEKQAGLIITHHPLFFKPIKSVDYSTPAGCMIKYILTHDLAVYSAHTNLDRSFKGTAKILAEKLGLCHIERYTNNPDDEMNMVVTGFFNPPKKPEELIGLLKELLECTDIRINGKLHDTKNVAVIPGSSGSVINKLKRVYDLVITGEVSYHEALYASYRGQLVAAVGHYACEKPVMHYLAASLAERFPDVTVHVSDRESEPFRSA